MNISGKTDERLVSLLYKKIKYAFRKRRGLMDTLLKSIVY